MARGSRLDNSQTFEKIRRRKQRHQVELTPRNAKRLEEAFTKGVINGCKKVSFASKVEAERTMTRWNSKPEDIFPGELRHAYRCTRCSQWHLTSWEKAKSQCMSMRNRKSYDSMRQALIALPEVNERRSTDYKPFKHAYKCSNCHGYHLTIFNRSTNGCKWPPYDSEHDALEAMDILNSQEPVGQEQLRSSYHCKKCGRYHLSNSPHGFNCVA